MAQLEFRNISKAFPGVQALLDVSFAARAGSVHALMGENGAGKSTLLKILSGAQPPTSGEVILNGTPRVFRSTAEALDAGIAVIYQELYLVPAMSVAENLLLGQLPSRWGVVNKRKLLEKSLQILRSIGEDILPDTPLGSLAIGQRQMVEIAKAISRDAQVIAFDEPTSSLSAREIQNLFRLIGELKAQGCVVLYVSHRMEEIFRICDALTILRDGRHVETFTSLAEVTPELLVRKMVGRDIQDVYGWRPRPIREKLLEVSGLEGPGISRPASLHVHRGEIVGLFGLVGAGRSELLKLIFGATPKQAGAMRVGKKTVEITRPRDAIRSGVMLCPEDRKKEGILPIRDVIENCNISARRHRAIWGMLIHQAWEESNATAQVNRLKIRTPSLRQQIRNLSGGNQQKVILGRWLSENMEVLLLDEPTRGIDVGAKREIYDIMYDLTQSGIGILMVSSDLPEVLGVSDRVLVMRQGEMTAEFTREEATPEKLLSAALPVGGAASQKESA